MFEDRAAAGSALAARLSQLAEPSALRVLGLPRGGVVVAAVVAEQLRTPLGVVVARKLGTPGHRELAMGAVAVWAEKFAVVRNDFVLVRARVDEAQFADVLQRELAEARRRATEWDPQPPQLDNAHVVLVDDGLATGATMRAAIAVVRRAGAQRIVVAVPVAAAPELEEIARTVDQVVAAQVPAAFGSVGAHYQSFNQVPDEVVAVELSRAADRTRLALSQPRTDQSGMDQPPTDQPRTVQSSKESSRRDSAGDSVEPGS